MFKKIASCLFVLLSLLIAANSYADTYLFSAYKFSWTVFANKQIVYQIIKEPSGIQVELYNQGLVRTSLFMTPDQASEISNMLSRTQKYYEQFNLVHRQVTEKYAIGKSFSVVFNKAKDTLSSKNKLVKGAFTVTIQNNNPYSPTKLTVNKNTAEALAKLMFQAPYRAAFINKKLYALNAYTPQN
jgi:hypothetical protein